MPDEKKIVVEGSETYTVGPPEHHGTIPVRTELLTLPADPAPKKIDFVIQVYSGGEVYRLVDDKMVEELLTERDALREGDIVACPSLVGYFRARVEFGGEGRVCARGVGNPDHVGMLDFDHDDRHCWTCSGTMNLRGLKKLELDREPTP